MFMNYKPGAARWAAVITFAAAAVAAVAQGAGPTRIEFWHYFGGEQERPLKELISRFEKENPDVKVNAYYQGRPPDLRQKLDASFATSPPNNPTVSTVYENWTSAFLKKGLMDPVQKYAGKPEGLSPEAVEDVVKVFRENNSWNGELVTMPFAKSIYMLYLNMDMLSAAGITTAPKTLTEYKTMIEKTTRREGRRTSVYGAGVQPVGEALTALLFAAGGEYFDAAGKPIFDDPKAVEILNMLKGQTRPERNLYLNVDHMSTPFASGQIAAYIYSSASFPYNEKGAKGKFRYEVAPVPGREGAEPRYLMQGMNLGLFKNRPEAERKAGMRFIKFLTEPRNAVHWATNTGYMPIRYSMLQEPEMQKYLAANRAYALASSLALSDKGKQEPTSAEWDGIRTEVSQAVDRVLNRGADPKRELDTMKGKVAIRLQKQP